jgi:hypothetical protein
VDDLDDGTDPNEIDDIATSAPDHGDPDAEGDDEK